MSVKINEEIKWLKEKLDFILKLEKMIKNNATGFVIAYEIEKMTEDFFYSDEFPTVYFMNLFVIVADDLKKCGNHPVLNKVKEHKDIKLELDQLKDDAKKQIGYLEFLKQKPKPKEIKEKIEYEKDLDDFISFLDQKFEEWEKSVEEKDGKKFVSS